MNFSCVSRPSSGLSRQLLTRMPQLLTSWCEKSLSNTLTCEIKLLSTLQWRHNERNGVSNHQSHQCLLNHLFGRRSKKTSTFRDTCLCTGNSSVTSEFPAQRASNAENVPIWFFHHVTLFCRKACVHWIDNSVITCLCYPLKHICTKTALSFIKVLVTPTAYIANSLDFHCSDVIMRAMAFQTTSVSIVYSTVFSGTDQRKHQSFAALAFVMAIHQRPVNSSRKGPITRKCFHLMNDVTM